MIYEIYENDIKICDVGTLTEAKATIKEWRSIDRQQYEFYKKYKIVKKDTDDEIKKFRVSSERFIETRKLGGRRKYE